VHDRAGAEEEQRLEERVVPDVEEAAGEAEHDPLRSAERAADRRHAEPEQDDPDVLDRVVGEEALEVVLREREDHAEERCQRAQREEHDAQRRGRSTSASVHQPVDADLITTPDMSAEMAGGRACAAGTSGAASPRPDPKATAEREDG
jgi:hypothetical protein